MKKIIDNTICTLLFFTDLINEKFSLYLYKSKHYDLIPKATNDQIAIDIIRQNKSYEFHIIAYGLFNKIISFNDLVSDNNIIDYGDMNEFNISMIVNDIDPESCIKFINKNNFYDYFLQKGFLNTGLLAKQIVTEIDDNALSPCIIFCQSYDNIENKFTIYKTNNVLPQTSIKVQIFIYANPIYFAPKQIEPLLIEYTINDRNSVVLSLPKRSHFENILISDKLLLEFAFSYFYEADLFLINNGKSLYGYILPERYNGVFVLDLQQNSFFKKQEKKNRVC